MRPRSSTRAFTSDWRAWLLAPCAHATHTTVGSTIGIGIRAPDGAIESRIRATTMHRAGQVTRNGTLTCGAANSHRSCHYGTAVASAATCTIRIHSIDMAAKRHARDMVP